MASAILLCRQPSLRRMADDTSDSLTTVSAPTDVGLATHLLFASGYLFGPKRSGPNRLRNAAEKHFGSEFLPLPPSRLPSGASMARPSCQWLHVFLSSLCQSLD